MKYKLLLLCLLVITKSSSNYIVQEAVDILHLINEVSHSILKVWHLVENVPHGSDIELPFLEDRQRKLLQHIDQVNQRIYQTEQLQIQLTTLTIENLTRVFKDETRLANRLAKVTSYIKDINHRHDLLREYQQGHYENSTLLKFAEWNLDPGSESLYSILQSFYDVFFGIDGKDYEKDSFKDCLLQHLTKNYEASPDQICETRQSGQQYANNLFIQATLTELKAYIMIEFSFMIRRELGVGNFSQEISLMRRKHEERLSMSQVVANQVLMNSDRVYWRCDPDGGRKKGHVLGETYEEITRLLQGYMENEVNLHENRECWGTCDEYSNTEIKGCYQPEKEFCGKQDKCNGRLHNCRYVDSDMWACLSPKNATKRYEYVELESGSILGKKRSFTNPHELNCDSKLQEVESWWRYLFWHCSYCLCLCDEQGPLSDRFFNLRDTITDFKRNRVATGVRFVKSQRVFHLQLQQGELLPHGAINGSSLEWLPIDSYDPDYVDIRNGFDYYTLTYDSRSLDLDEIVSESSSSDQVVTGVRFQVLDNRLNLEVRFSEYNFTTGLLHEPETRSIWLSNKNTESRQLLFLNNPDLSTNSILKSLPLSQHNQFMEFVSSSVDADAAQSTVPFIDIQEVVPQPVVPLAGLGLYHKGREGFGGFFAPKVITYDISKNFLKQLN